MAKRWIFAAVIAASLCASPASSQTIGCIGPTGGNCVPVVVQQTVAGAAGYPAGAVPIQGNATGTTGAVVGTLAGVALKTTYICGVSVSSAGTGSIGPVTIAGLVTASQVYQLTAPGTFNLSFTPCIAASAVNTGITTTTTADGTATAVDVNSWGFQL